MRKTLYYAIIGICMIVFFSLKDEICIGCIEKEDNICLTSSVVEVREFIYRYIGCPNCK